MSGKVRKIIIGFLMALAVVFVVPVSGMTVLAATAKISFSDPSVTVGQEFSVNVKITSPDGNLGAADVMLSYDPASIEFISGNNASGGAGSVRLVGTMDSGNTTQFAHTLKFKALQAGNSTISVGNYEIYDVDTQAVNVTKVGASAVKVNAPATYSSEAGLSSLKVSPGQLTPAFSPDVTSYSVNVGGDVTKLAVSAGTKDSKAKVLVSGDSGLKTGANTVVCKITAEDGKTTKTYTITVNKAESTETAEEPETENAEQTEAAVMGAQTAEIDGVSYSVATSFDPSLLPEGYTQSSVTYGDTEVMCGSGNNLTLIYLQAEDGTGSFFIYEPESGQLSPFVTIDVSAKSILVLPPDDSLELPEGFAPTSIQLNGNYKVQGWVWQSDTEQQYCVVYGLNENGEKNLYRYDIAEKTFQRYFKDPALQSKYDDAKVDELIDQYNSLCEDYNFRFIIIVALLVVCLILVFIIVNLLIHRRESEEETKTSPEKRGTSERVARTERNVTVDRTAAAERKAAYERAVAAERRAAREQAAASGKRAASETDVRTDRPEMNVTKRAEALERRMSSGYSAASPRRGEETTELRREPVREKHITRDPGMEAVIRQREQERAQRARLSRERLEKERREDARRAAAAAARESASTVSRLQDDDDFEILDL